LNDPLLHPELSCPNNIRKEGTNESFSKTITNHLAFPVLYAFEFEIPISDNCQQFAIDDDNGISDQSGSGPANHALWA
jgi:hypothetical protein